MTTRTEPRPLTPRQQQALDAWRGLTHHTVRDLARALGITVNAAQQLLVRLRRKGWLAPTRPHEEEEHDEEPLPAGVLSPALAAEIERRILRYADRAARRLPLFEGAPEGER